MTKDERCRPCRKIWSRWGSWPLRFELLRYLRNPAGIIVHLGVIFFKLSSSYKLTPSLNLHFRARFCPCNIDRAYTYWIRVGFDNALFYIMDYATWRRKKFKEEKLGKARNGPAPPNLIFLFKMERQVDLFLLLPSSLFRLERERRKSCSKHNSTTHLPTLSLYISFLFSPTVTRARSTGKMNHPETIGGFLFKGENQSGRPCVLATAIGYGDIIEKRKHGSRLLFTAHQIRWTLAS